MKCDKCGFVSFDYLAECRRCGADLAIIRERLGFSSLKSEVPFLLGSLLKGGAPGAPMTRVGREPEESAEKSMSDLAVESSFEMPAPAPEAGEKRVPPAREELIIELSEADLESLSGGKQSKK